MLGEVCFNHLPEEVRLAASGPFPELEWAPGAPSAAAPGSIEPIVGESIQAHRDAPCR